VVIESRLRATGDGIFFFRVEVGLARIAVIGIGNVLTGDDAIGPYVVRVLEAGFSFPSDVEVYDAGTPGLDLTAYISGLEALVVVDAVRAKGAPGDLKLYSKEEILKGAPILAMSPHEPGVRESLLNADFMGVCPRTVRLVGMIPESVEYGLGLSAPARAAVPKLVDQVLSELRALGVEAARRDPPAEPDLWWERKPGA
jgi:hydrogenase maturation protease